jgi:hypothetical protein
MNSDSSSDSKSLFDVFKKDNLINSTSKINNLYQNMSNNSTLYIGLFFVIIFTVIIAILLYTFLGWQLFSKIEQNVSDTKIPVVGTKLTKFKAELADTANGVRRSFSFWIYINDTNKYYGQYKNVLALSTDPNNYNPALSSPHVFLDKNNNSMYIRFNKKAKYNSNGKPDTTSSNVNLCMDKNDINNYMKSGIHIKYIPIQRWVNVVIVCNSDSFKTTLYAYIDGDLVNTITDGDKDIVIGNIKIPSINLTDIDLNASGYLYTGSDNIGKCGPGFSGLIANFTSFNYELNPKDIYNIYNKGPINGLLARLGLAAYGVRSPIYKI